MPFAFENNQKGVVPGGIEDVPTEATPVPDRPEFAFQKEAATAVPDLTQAVQGNPDKAAKTRDLAKETGLPEEVVRDNTESAEAQSQVRQINSILSNNPITSSFLSQPRNAEIAHDSVEGLSAIERISRGFDRGVTTHELGRAGIASISDRSPEAKARVAGLQKRLQELGRDTENDFVSFLAAASEVVGQQVESLTGPEAAGRITAGTAVGAAAGLAGGPLAPITVPAGLAGGFVSGVTAHFILDSFEVEGGSSYIELLEEGIEPDTAAFLAYGVGTLNAALEVGGAAVIFKPLSEGVKTLIRQGVRDTVKSKTVREAAQEAVKAYAAGVFAEVGTEVLQESVNIAAVELGRELQGIEETVTPEEITERLTDIAVQTFKAVTILGSAPAGINFTIQVSEANKTEKNAAVLDEINEMVLTNPVTERSAETSALHLTEVLKENDIDRVYIPAKELASWLLEAPDGPAMIRKLGVQDQIEEAILFGQDVTIQGDRFSREILGSERYQEISDHIRLKQDGMTPAEATEFGEQGLQELVDKIDIEKGPFIVFNVKEKTGLEGVFGTEKQAQAFINTQENPLDFDFDTSENLTEREISPEEIVLELGRIAREATSSDTEISIAAEEIALKEFFRTAEEAGMNERQFRNYQQNILDTFRQAEINKQETELRRAQVESTKEFKKARQRIEETTREHLTQTVPAYQVVNDIQAVRLNREMTQAILRGLGVELSALPKQDRNRNIFTSGKEEGISPDALAELHGYEDGVAMLADLVTTPPLEEAISQQTERRLNQEFGDVRSRIQALQNARAALNNDARSNVLEAELNALRTAQKEKRLSPKIIRRIAKEKLKTVKMKDINPNDFLANERRLALAAGKALRKNERVLAKELKFQQLVNFHMAQEAFRQAEKIRRQTTFMARFQSVRSIPTLPVQYLNAIQEQLNHVSFRPRPTVKELKNLLEVAQKVADPAKVPRRLRDVLRPTNWQDMTLEQFQELHDTVKEIEHKGKQRNKMRRKQEEQELDITAAFIIDKIDKNLTPVKGKRTTQQEISRFEGAKRFSRELRTMLFNADTILREVDGFENLGPVYEAVKGRYDRSVTEGYRDDQIGLLRRQNVVAQDVLDLYSPFTQKEQKQFHQKVEIPGVERRLTRNQYLSTLLNLGNAGNLNALVDSRTFTMEEIESIKEFASKRDWDFVQSVWDYLETFWPEIVKSEQNRRNYTPERVAATPIETRHGTFKGGYYPVHYDKKEAIIPVKIDQDEFVDRMRFGSYTQSQTSRGHVEQRKATTGHPVLLDMLALNRHLDSVVYDLEVGDAVTDIHKVLYHKEVRQAFTDAGARHKWEHLDLWLRDVITGEQMTGAAIERGLRWLRSGFTISKLGWNIGVILLQPLGVIQASSLVGKRNMAKGVWGVLRSPWVGENSVFKFVAEQSGFMEVRQTTFNKDIIDAQKILGKSLLDRALPGKTAEHVRNSFFVGIKATQRITDTMTWLGAYNQAIQDLQFDQTKAVEHADRMVARTQASGIFGERTPLERGSTNKRFAQSEFVRAFTPLISFFMAKTNVAIERTKQLGGVKGAVTNPVRTLNWAMDMIMLYVVEAILAGLIRGQWPEEGDDETFIEYAASESIGTVMAGVPILREVSSEVQGFRGGGTVSQLAKDTAKAFEQVEQGELDEAFVRRVNNLGGLLLKYPSSQLNKTFSAFSKQSEGEDISAVEFIMGPHFDR